jgi:nucleoid-associated protein YgaU
MSITAKLLPDRGSGKTPVGQTWHGRLARVLWTRLPGRKGFCKSLVVLTATLLVGEFAERRGVAAETDETEPSAGRAAAPATNETETTTPSAAAKPPAATALAATPAEDLAGWTRKYETLERELRDTQARFAAIRLKIHESTPPARCGGRLAELERKALAYEAVQGQIEYKDAMIETMRSALDETRTTLEAQRKEILALSDKIAAQTADLSASAEEKARLKKSLDLLRLGQYEYYEIKEGDTVESIAAQPSVYGDAARHVLIRQANRGHVKDLDRLVPGEVVIIPRFPASGRYEF